MDKIVEIEIGGETRKLKYDYNAVADIEGKIGTSLAVAFSDDKIGFNTLRHLLWGGLKWKNRTITPEAAGMMIGEYLEAGGEVTDLMSKLMEALSKCKAFAGNSKAEAE